MSTTATAPVTAPVTTPDTTTTGATDVEAQRAAVKHDVAATLRYLGTHGYQYALAGHVTVRDPGEPERYWVNPTGLPFSVITPDDLVLVDPDGTVVAGRHGANGYHGQLEVHRARPDLRAGLHLHSEHTFAWSSAGGVLAPLTTDASWIRPWIAVRDSFAVPGSQALGDTARILVQRAHGAVTFGASILEAAFWWVSFERAAKTELLLRAAGLARDIDADLQEKWQLTPQAAHEQFAPVLAAFVASEPGNFGRSGAITPA